MALPDSWRTPYEMGFSVFPVELRSKTPLCAWKAYQSERAPVETLQAWAKRPSNVGIATGAVSGLIVLDLDTAEAIAEAERRGLPDTVTVRSSKGLHVYFRHPGGTIGNRAGLLPGTDIRGDGGYVVAPGSIHESGVTYAWENPPGLFELADPPAWLLDLLKEPDRPAKGNGGDPYTRQGFMQSPLATSWAEAALRSEIAELMNAPAGKRNVQLNNSALKLAQLVAADHLDDFTVKRRLHSAAVAIGLDTDEIQPTIESGFAKGLTEPRDPPDRETRRPQNDEPAHDPETGEVLKPKLLPLIDMLHWTQDDAPVREFAWGDWIPLRQTTMLTGRGGVGKSLFEQMLCTCIALGLPFLGMETRQMNALYITAEDDEDELWRRQSAICSSLGVPLAGLIGRLSLGSLCGVQDTALATFDENHRLRVTDRWREVAATADEFAIRFAAFDNATDMMAGDHNDIHEVAEFVNLLTGFAIRRDGVSMILHHPNKAGDDWLGSIAWHNKVRSRLIVKDGDLEGDNDARQILNPKANYGPSGGRVNFRWFKGAFVRDEDLPPNMMEEIAANAAANHDNDIFLACLTLRNNQQRRVSDASGKAYAPAVFADMPESKGVGKRRLEQAMDRLFRIGKIESGYLWRFDGKDRFGLRLADANASANGPPTHFANGRQQDAPTDANTHLGTTYHKGAATQAAAPSGQEAAQ